MFKKIGDLHPISIVEPVDVDNESTKKSLKKAIKTTKDIEKKSEKPIEVAAPKKELEN